LFAQMVQAALVEEAAQEQEVEHRSRSRRLGSQRAAHRPVYHP
jgi:hypothetical protein